MSTNQVNLNNLAVVQTIKLSAQGGQTRRFAIPVHRLKALGIAADEDVKLELCVDPQQPSVMVVRKVEE